MNLEYSYQAGEKKSDFVNMSESNAQVLSMSHIALFFLKPASYPPLLSVSKSSKGFFMKQSDEKINNLTDIIQSLALTTLILKQNAKIGAKTLLANTTTLSREN